MAGAHRRLGRGLGRRLEVDVALQAGRGHRLEALERRALARERLRLVHHRDDDLLLLARLDLHDEELRVVDDRRQQRGLRDLLGQPGVLLRVRLLAPQPFSTDAEGGNIEARNVFRIAFLSLNLECFKLFEVTRP